MTRLIGAGALVLALVALAVWYRGTGAPQAPAPDAATAPLGQARTAPPPAEAERAAIAVLPFHNLGTDREQEYFADGMTDDLITDLTKLSGLLVIARDSVFAYKGANQNVREIGRELNVRYILHGSVRKAGDTVRINTQLTDTSNGAQLWAERYDGQLTDIFALQDRITQAITGTLAVRLTERENSVLERREPIDVDTYDLFLRAQAQYFLHAHSGNLQAQAMYREVIARAPRFARAYAQLAMTYWFEFSNGWTDDAGAALAQADRLARQALSLDENLPEAYFVTGVVHRERKEYLDAVYDAEKAIEADPSFANGRVLLATVLYYTGRPEEGLKRMQEASRLHPHSPHNYPFHIGQAYFVLKRYDEAIAQFRQGLDTRPTSQRLRLWLASAYALSGALGEARWELEQVLVGDPELTIGKMKAAYPFRYNADLEIFLDGLRKAGLPE